MSTQASPGAAAAASAPSGAPAIAPRALVYLACVTIATFAAALPALGSMKLGEPGWPTFLLLAAGAGGSQLFVVFTPRNQSYHASIAFIVAAALLLPPELVVLMGVLQHIPEWLRLRYPWYIQTFNICNYTLSGLAAWGAVRLVHGSATIDSGGRWALAAVAACLVFVALNHALLAAMLYLARGHNIKATALFTAESLVTDAVIAALGVTLAIFWHWNHWLVPVALLPLVLVHRSLRVPLLREQARNDAKTELLNPRAFAESLEQELARAVRYRRPLSVLVADLDLLREINNTYGHLAGDTAIVGIADILRAELRDYDVPSRFGGEEFAILLPETPYAEALEIAERVRAVVADRDFLVEATSKTIHVTVSIGVASVPEHGEDATALLHQADVALYRAKASGRNRVVGADAPMTDQEVAAAILADLDPAADGTTPALADRAVPAAEEHVAAAPAVLRSMMSPMAAAARAVAASAPSVAGPAAGALSARRGGASMDTVMSWRRTPQALRWLVIGVGAAGISAGVLGALFGGSSDLIGILALVALVAAGQAVAIASEHGSVSVGAVGALMGAAVFGPRAALGIAIAMAAVEWSARRSSWFQVVFNAGALALAGLAAAGICALGSLLSGSRAVQLVAALVAAGAYYVVNVGLLAIALALAEGERPLAVWRDRFSWLAWHYIAYGLLAGVLGLAYQEAGLYALVVAAVPVLVLRRTQAAYLRRASESAARLHAAAETIQHQNASLVDANRELRKRSAEALEGLSATVDARDAYTAGHSRRVRDLAVDIGRELSLGEADIEVLGNAALFHDIGKLAIPDVILLKPSALDAAEWAVMRRHPEESARIVGRLGFLSDCVPAILHHHERYNGGGYPQGIGGLDIPLGARIIHVADTIDAMMTRRTYRGASTLGETMDELARVSGVQLCPLCVTAARRVLKRSAPAAVQLAS